MQGRHCNRSCLVPATYMHFCHAILALLLLFHNALEDLQWTRTSHWPQGRLYGNSRALLCWHTSTVSGASTACPSSVLSYCCCLFSTLPARSLTKGQPGHLAQIERDLGSAYTSDAACHPADAGFTYLPCYCWSCPAAWTFSGSSCCQWTACPNAVQAEGLSDLTLLGHDPCWRAPKTMFKVKFTGTVYSLWAMWETQLLVG